MHFTKCYIMLNIRAKFHGFQSRSETPNILTKIPKLKQCCNPYMKNLLVTYTIIQTLARQHDSIDPPLFPH